MSSCELCDPKEVVFESDFAYVRYDSHALAPGHDPRGGIRCVLAGKK